MNKLIDRLGIMLLGVIVALLIVTLSVLKAPKIAVEIYSTGDPPEIIYCATGSLAPPATYLGSGTVNKGQESYC